MNFSSGKYPCVHQSSSLTKTSFVLLVHFALLQCTVSIMLVHNNDIEHDGADKMSYVFDYCYEDKKGVSFVYVVQCRWKI